MPALHFHMLAVGAPGVRFVSVLDSTPLLRESARCTNLSAGLARSRIGMCSTLPAN